MITIHDNSKASVHAMIDGLRASGKLEPIAPDAAGLTSAKRADKIAACGYLLQSSQHVPNNLTAMMEIVIHAKDITSEFPSYRTVRDCLIGIGIYDADIRLHSTGDRLTKWIGSAL